MVTEIPVNWKYTDELEMLFLFYQCADELTSEHTIDTYTIPLHNAITLVFEMDYIYNKLLKYNLVESYYENYIIAIIDEFLDNLKKDKILKNILGKRLTSITVGFTESKKNHVLLKRWINIFGQYCTLDKYISLYKKEIITLVFSSNDKKKLIDITKKLFTCLIFAGYSREYIFVTIKRYFNNKRIEINSKNQIVDFLDIFDCEEKNWEFLILMDLNSIEYLDSLSNNIIISRKIEKIDIEKERKELCKDNKVNDLFEAYDKLFHKKNKVDYQKFSIIKYCTSSLDQYNAIEEFGDHIRILQSFSVYFKHHKLHRQIFNVLMKDATGYYKEVKMPDKLLKRPYVEQKDIDFRIENILQANYLSADSFLSLTNAISMHSESLDSQNVATLIKNLWTSLETLFSTLGRNETKSNVSENTLAIIQKTYLLKILRSLYSQVEGSLSRAELNELYIDDFKKFIRYFASNKAEDMKALYNKLGINILLRTRIYGLRKELTNSKKIEQYLEKHEVRVRWQLQRIYRTRNIITHLGIEMYYSNIIVNHLHNYFDYIVNYIVCKICNKDYVSSIGTVVFEAKNDNSLYKEMLKKNEELSIDNYMELLFGPDDRLLEYDFK